jgi:hypothetical protein
MRLVGDVSFLALKISYGSQSLKDCPSGHVREQSSHSSSVATSQYGNGVRRLARRRRMHKFFRLGRERIKIFAIDETRRDRSERCWSRSLSLRSLRTVCKQDSRIVFLCMESKFHICGDVSQGSCLEVRSSSRLD